MHGMGGHRRALGAERRRRLQRHARGAGAATEAASFTFLQISDSHVGFAKPANPDARATLREAVAKIAGMPVKPDFIVHTGDITQLSRDSEFDDADQILRETGIQTFFVPGEHDMLDEGAGKAFLARYGKMHRAARARAGSASIIRACISSASSMSPISSPAAWAGSVPSRSPG